MSKSTIKQSRRLFGNTPHNVYYNLDTFSGTLDELFSNIPNNNNSTIGIDLKGNLTEISTANRFFIIAWKNETGTYAVALIMAFSGVWYATRTNSDAFVINKIAYVVGGG